MPVAAVAHWSDSILIANFERWIKLLDTLGSKYWSLGVLFFLRGGEMTSITIAGNVTTEFQDWVLKEI